MSILALILIIAALGFAAWLASKFSGQGIDPKFVGVIHVVLLIIAVFVVFKAFFGVDPLAELQRPVR